MASDRSWLILREGDRRRWGGDLRRHYLFDGLAEATGGEVLEDRRSATITPLLRRLRGPRWQVWRRPALVASTEVLIDKLFAPVARDGVPAAVDIHDDVRLQNDALGIETPPDVEARARSVDDLNRNGFALLVAPSAPFATLAGLDPSRVVVASNGSATEVVRPAAWREQPAVAMVSGAAPRRGIEELIEAVRVVRETVPDVRLDLWLAATGDDSQAYLDRLRASVADRPWIAIDRVAYEGLGEALGRATALAIPTPGHPYWDSVAPVKLFDYLAAGRPVVTTPRVETAALVRRHEAGVVAEDDSAAAMAAALRTVLTAPDAARDMGARARSVAERQYDWKAIGRRLAGEILDRIG
jgi:glycosyltransferase involved in cell wall biosynthesis